MLRPPGTFGFGFAGSAPSPRFACNARSGPIRPAARRETTFDPPSTGCRKDR